MTGRFRKKSKKTNRAPKHTVCCDHKIFQIFRTVKFIFFTSFCLTNPFQYIYIIWLMDFRRTGRFSPLKHKIRNRRHAPPVDLPGERNKMPNLESDSVQNQHYRVLLVSHTPLLQFSLSNFFKDTDISITAAGSSAEALEYMQRETFDAIIFEIGSDGDGSLQFRKNVRLSDIKIPILFMTPLFYWSDVKLLDRIVEDPHSYYIPENADRKFMTAKLQQVIHACQAENSLKSLQNTISRNWFLAGVLQQAMLPPWVYFGGNYEFSCFYRPFTQVSGDLFEWLPLGEDEALFIFGDISGHGTHSALAMTAVQSFLKQIILLDKEKARHPDLIAADINDFFCTHLHNIVHMSTLIAYIDFKNNYLCYQNAGYMDMLCLDAETGQYQDINPEKRGCLPLGMVKSAVYTEEDNVEYRFADSAVFLFASDGLVSLSKDKDGSNHLDLDMCLKLASLLVTDTKKENKSITIPFLAYHSLTQFGYVFPQDDLTMVLIRKPVYPEKEYVFSCRVPADKEAVDEICEKASSFVSKFYEGDEIPTNVELLLGEYLVNVIMHGLNKYEKLNEYIAVKLCAYPDKLKVMVWDHGKEWHGLAMRQSAAEQELERLNDNLAASGRGLPIISMIASQISRQRYCGLNESIFVVPVKTASQPEAEN